MLNNNDDDLEWEQSCDAQGEPLQAHSKTTWALLNEAGEEVEEGDLQEWNGRAFIVLNQSIILAV